MRVGARQRHGRLAGGAVEQAACGRRPRICDAPREHDRADDRAVGHERRGDRVAQAVGTANSRGDAVGDLLHAVRAAPDLGPGRRRRHVRAPESRDLRDGPGRHDRNRSGYRAGDCRDGLGLDRDRDRFGRDELPVGGPVDPLLEVRDGQDRRRVGNARPGAHEGRVEDPRARAPAGDDDMIGARRLRELLDDRVDHGVGGHRAGQARQDPGERLGLGSLLSFERSDRVPMHDRGGPGRHDQREHEPVEQAARVGDEAVGGDQAEGDEDAGDGPPRPLDPRIVLVGVR